jgi:hypothetical protein
MGPSCAFTTQYHGIINGQLAVLCASKYNLMAVGLFGNLSELFCTLSVEQLTTLSFSLLLGTRSNPFSMLSEPDEVFSRSAVA